jgi:hypothetical protein
MGKRTGDGFGEENMGRIAEIRWRDSKLKGILVTAALAFRSNR